MSTSSTSYSSNLPAAGSTISGSTNLPTATGSRKSDGNKKHIHHEDLLLRSWRSIANGVTLVTSKAERVVTVGTAADSSPAAKDAAMKDLNDSTIGLLRNHVEWGRNLSYVEAKLEGKAAEMEALQHFIRAHPSIGHKRKRS